MTSGHKSNPRGRCYLVGAGPGDPGLLTCRGAEALCSCDAVYYDHLAAPELLALAPADARRVYVGKRAGDHAVPQTELCAHLVREVQAGRTVVRLKGGDPFVFGRGGEEALALRRAGMPVTVVPGVTAGVAALAYAGIPLTHRGLAVSAAFVTGHEDPDKEESQLDWAGLARIDTLCIYMGVGRVGELVARLIQHGRDAAVPSAAIEWGTTPRQRTVTSALADLPQAMAAAGIAPPALLVSGAVVALRPELDWFESLPLFGTSVLVTRARHQASRFSRMLGEAGARVFELPAIEIGPPDSYAALDSALAQLAATDWLVFTSTNGVEAFFSRLEGRGQDARALGGCRIAVIGDGTAAALRTHGVRADLVPERFVAEALLEALRQTDAIAGRQVLLCRAQSARSVLPDGLRAAGAVVTDVPVYQTVPVREPDAAAMEALAAEAVDVLTFASSSTVRYFADLVGSERLASLLQSPKRPRCVSIGPITSATLSEQGFPVDAEADPHNLEGLFAAVSRVQTDNRPEPQS